MLVMGGGGVVEEEGCCARKEGEEGRGREGGIGWG